MGFDPSIGAATRWKKGGLAQIRVAGQSPVCYRRHSERDSVKINPGDPSGRTFAEVVAANLIEIACTEGPGAVHAASEIADRLDRRSRQQVEFADITAELRNKWTRSCSFISTTIAGPPTRRRCCSQHQSVGRPPNSLGPLLGRSRF
jgi:hypothetical protein